MSAEIVNLRKARKSKARADKERQADRNRAKFGRPKREREKVKADETAARRWLDAHRRDKDDDEPSS